MAAEVSRRNFLAGVAGVGALAAAGLAGCAPSVAGEGKTADAEGKGATDGVADWLGEAPEITDIAETKECDLLVVGAGNGGSTALFRILPSPSFSTTSVCGVGTLPSEWIRTLIP